MCIRDSYLTFVYFPVIYDFVKIMAACLIDLSQLTRFPNCYVIRNVTLEAAFQTNKHRPTYRSTRTNIHTLHRYYSSPNREHLVISDSQRLTAGISKTCSSTCSCRFFVNNLCIVQSIALLQDYFVMSLVMHVCIRLPYGKFYFCLLYTSLAFTVIVILILFFIIRFIIYGCVLVQSLCDFCV